MRRIRELPPIRSCALRLAALVALGALSGCLAADPREADDRAAAPPAPREHAKEALRRLLGRAMPWVPGTGTREREDNRLEAISVDDAGFGFRYAQGTKRYVYREIELRAYDGPNSVGFVLSLTGDQPYINPMTTGAWRDCLWFMYRGDRDECAAVLERLKAEVLSREGAGGENSPARRTDAR